MLEKQVYNYRGITWSTLKELADALGKKYDTVRQGVVQKGYEAYIDTVLRDCTIEHYLQDLENSRNGYYGYRWDNISNLADQLDICGTTISTWLVSNPDKTISDFLDWYYYCKKHGLVVGQTKVFTYRGISYRNITQILTILKCDRYCYDVWRKTVGPLVDTHEFIDYILGSFTLEEYFALGAGEIEYKRYRGIPCRFWQDVAVALGVSIDGMREWYRQTGGNLLEYIDFTLKECSLSEYNVLGPDTGIYNKTSLELVQCNMSEDCKKFLASLLSDWKAEKIRSNK